MEARNQYGCYTDRQARALYGPGWRDFCIRLVAQEDAPLGFEAVTEESLGTGCIDCMIYEEITTRRMPLGDHEAEVQVALATGGIGHKRRRPELMATFPIGQGEVVVITAEFGDADDAAVILGIAGTVSLR